MPHPNETPVTHMVHPDDLKSVRFDLSANSLDKKCTGIPIALVYVTENLYTHLLWQRAIQRIGADILEVANLELVHARDTKSYAKFIQTFAQFASAIILNHPESHASEIAATISPVPIINANFPLESTDIFADDAQRNVLNCMAILQYVLKSNP